MYKDTRDARIKLLGETYHARFSCKGTRVQESLRTKNFKVAVALADDIQNSILLGEDWKKEKDLFEDCWPVFLEAKAQGKMRGKKIKKVREKTLKEYIGFGDRYYLPFFGKDRVDKIDGEKWDQYLSYVKANSKRGTTKFLNHWKYMSGFMSWCLATGRIKAMPDIYNPDEDDEVDGVGKNYTDEELKLFRTNSEYHIRMHLWILCAQYMGMRSSEITQLHKDRIDLNAMLIRLKKQDTKTNEARNVPIHPAVLPTLKSVMDEFSHSPYLFPNRDDARRPMDPTGFKKAWNALKQKAGVDGRFHDFRHSYATRIFSNPDVNPVLVCKALGMSMRVAMKVYIHFDESHLHKVTGSFSLSGEKKRKVSGENLVNRGFCESH